MMKSTKCIQNITQIVINKNSFHDFKRRMALYSSKKLSSLLSGISPKHHGDFYCLNCFHSLTAENKHESDEENKDFHKV